LLVAGSFALPALLVVPGCGESTPTPPPAPETPAATDGGTPPIMKNAAAAKSKTTDEDTSHSLRSKNRKKD